MLRFQRGLASEAFQILENHFIKLWLVSDLTFLHFYQRWEDRETIIKDVFAKRGKWLREVYEILRRGGPEARCNQDRRDWPRQACDTHLAVRVQNKQQGWDSDAFVINSSEEGLALELNVPLPTGVKRLEVLPCSSAGPSQGSPGAMFLLNSFANLAYEIVRMQSGTTTIIGLKKAA